MLEHNGKKSRLKLADFLKASSTMGIEERITLQLIENMKNALPVWKDIIKASFLSKEMQDAYQTLISQRFQALEL